MRTLLLTTLLAIGQIYSYAQLQPGQIAFIGFDVDEDSFAFIPLVTLDAGTVIYFSDNEWNELPIGSGGAFTDTNEGIVTWSTSAEISAGTVISITEVGSSATMQTSTGSITKSGTMNFSGDDETLYAYLGTDGQTPSSFLTAISNDEFIATSGTLTNTGLTAGINAIAIDGDEDLAIYTGSTICNSTISACSAMLTDPSNWTTADGTGAQSSDGLYPEWSDLPASFGGVVLPVTWLYFQSDFTKQNQLTLLWATASEFNCSHFIVESSADGLSFDALEEIAGHGTTHEISYYQFETEMTSALSYYRLRQVDFDGKFAYSATLRLLHPDMAFQVFPNPAVDHFKILAPPVDYQAVLVDLQGKTHLNISTQGSKTINLQNLPEGIYVLKILASDFGTSHRIVKK